MKTEQHYFEEAKTLEQYMNDMTTKKEESFSIYDQFEVPADDEFIEILKTKKPHILAITEDWCGDAMMNNAIIRKVSEAAGLETRAVYRDENLELMDQYLTNGGRSIPVYLLLNDDGKVISKWGPRAEVVQKFVMDGRAKFPDKEDPAFEETQKKFYEQMTHEFMTNNEFHLAVYEDIRSHWLPILQNK
ncbi:MULTISPECIES: thioredoxin family protein [unclassified Psychrobacillus]|uniref:thioredoxin family protein n=1 Tax=unclassified Psychrobacillus TaxID=2636677 RepID=UPI001245F202|nr:thioredoxin family protein [Psychrobacillus sp. AK 1817]QEY22110.1 thioredoxin family protein [Psychrobacillus sp. AK 1817]